MARKIRIIHVINSFEFGGAEAMLCNLLLRTDLDRFEPSVALLIDEMSVGGPVCDAGVEVARMGMRPGVPDPRGLARLAWHFHRSRPDIVQTWMDHSNLIGGAAAWLSTRTPVVWGIHHSDHVRGLTKRSTLMTVAACAKLSRRLPRKIIVCSEHASRRYAEQGFDRERMRVIPNGFDTGSFRPDSAARKLVREELGIAPAADVIGLVARYDPLKDHANFLNAAAILRRRYPHARFLLCGAGVDARNEALVREIEARNLQDYCILAGPRRDMPRVFAAFDVLVSSSISEAFPLVIGEAMACGVPCAATDVGDSALIIGRTGRVVKPRNSEALAEAAGELLEMRPEQRRQLGVEARRRVCEHFDLSAVTRRYEAVYESLLAANEPRQEPAREAQERGAVNCSLTK